MLPESSWPWVIPALMNDSLIWRSLHDQEFLNMVVENFPNPEEWSPAKIAFVELGCTGIDSLEEAHHGEGEDLVEHYSKVEILPGPDDLSLREAALLAVGLNDRMRNEDWVELVEVINSSLDDSSGWSTPIAMLLGMVSDKQKAIDKLFINKQPSRLMPIVIDGILSQQLTHSELQKLILYILDGSSLDFAAGILTKLKLTHPELSMRIANEWRESSNQEIVISSYTGINERISQMTQFLLSAEIDSISGRLEKAAQKRMRAIETLNAIHSLTASQLVADSLRTNNLEHALVTWTKSLKTPQFTPPAGLIVQLLRGGRLEDSSTLLTEFQGKSQSPLNWLNQIYQAISQEDVSQARLFAHQSLNSFLKLYEMGPGSTAAIFNSQSELISFLSELCRLLSELALYKEALQAARTACEIKMQDPRLLIQLSAASRAAGEFEISVQAAEHAIAVNPQNPEYRRQLAMSLEYSGQWSESLVERKAIIDHRFAQPDSPAWPTIEDLLSLANCALHAGEHQEAFEITQKAIKLDPSNGYAQAMLGKALSELGEENQAMEHFKLATQLAPHDAESWLSLSHAYLSAGNNEKAVETLRTASHAVPEDPEVFFALGQIYINDDALTQAQKVIERAYQLVSTPILMQSPHGTGENHTAAVDKFARLREQQCEIALSYGDILNKLGHATEAVQVYENAYQAYPSYPGLAYTFASALLKAGDEKSALAPLTIAVSSKPDNPKPYLEYAQALLTTEVNPEQAVKALEAGLSIIASMQNGKQELDSNSLSESELTQLHELGLALLAQSQAASGDLEKSLHTYSQALETSLAKEDEWQAKLAIGMGRVALELGQPEIAIAALKEISQDEIQDTSVAQILAEAYGAISLTQEALSAARKAVKLAPDDVEILSWFAEKAISFGVESEAAPALTSAAQLDPQRTDLVIRLGKVFSMLGNTKSAKEAFLSSLSSMYATPEDLYQAADGLSDLGENESAADCLERALELQPHPPLALILDLADAYQSVNKNELAVRTIDKGIENEPENVHLHTFKADILSKLGRHSAAQSCLEHALILQPEDPQINLRMAELLREQGNLYNAFNHAIKIGADRSKGPETTFEILVLGLTADLARATLQDSIYRELLEDVPSLSVPEPEQLDSNLVSPLTALYCLFAESALEREEQISAAEALNSAYSLDPNHPRVLALQSRMALRQGDETEALSLFNMAAEMIHDSHLENKALHSTSTFLGVASAGIDLQEWDQAREILENGSSISPNEPILHLTLAKIYVLQAEFLRICQMAEIVRHNPDARALSPSSFRLFEDAIQETINSLSKDQRIQIPAGVSRWRSRGKIAFQPNQENIQEFSRHSLEGSDQAALLIAHAAVEDLASIAKQFHLISDGKDVRRIDSAILLVYALSVSLYSPDEIGIETALDGIHAVIEMHPNRAISYWVQAKLAEMVGEVGSAKSAIGNALSIWPDEPRWQAFAARIAQRIGEETEVINHLENAVSLEPSYLPHYLELGQNYLDQGQNAEAIEIYGKAIELAPDQVEVYLAQASAQCSQHKYKSAIKNVDKAIRMAPKDAEPLLLRAEIALDMDNSQEALENIDAALEINPEHPRALFLQSAAYQALGNDDQALKMIEKAIPLADDPLPLLLKRIEINSNKVGIETNLEELENISQQYPGNSLVLAPLAHALAACGRNHESIQAAQQALSFKDSDLSIQDRADLHHLLGLELKNAGQLDQSIFQLNESMRLAPNNIRTYLDLGLTHEERRQHGTALEIYKQAISISPTDPRPYYQAGILLKASRDYPAAESMLRRAAQRAPDDISIHRQLAGLVAINLIHNRQPAEQEI